MVETAYEKETKALQNNAAGINKDILFTAALAHEIRNPLANIDLSVDLINASSSEEERKIYTDIILQSTERINILVKGLLTEATVNEVVLESHSISALLDEVLEMINSSVILKKVKITRDYTTEDHCRVVNKVEIKIALTNIIVNAIEAMPPDDRKLTVDTRIINGKCVIGIEDNGIGMSVESLKHIFQPGYTQKVGGLGLGLYITHEILLANHIEMNVSSLPGKGTRFIMTLD